jgi:hypothetical protein
VFACSVDMQNRQGSFDCTGQSQRMHECDLAAMSKIGGVQNSPEGLWSNLSHEQYSKSVLIGNTFQ